MELRTRSLNLKGSDNKANGLFVKGCSKNSSNFIGSSRRRKLSDIIAKSMGITNPSALS